MSPVKWAARAALHRFGGLRVLRAGSRGALRILCYHRFPLSARGEFARHCAHIRAHYSAVTMTDVARWLAGERGLPPHAAAITVDDGYRDFYEVAWPILRRYQLPATVYLTTGFLDRQSWLWVDRVEYAVENAGLRAAELELNGLTLRVNLTPGKPRRIAADLLKLALKRAPNEERVRFLWRLPRMLHASIPDEPPAEFAPLTWDQVREMNRNGIEFGAHTVSHPILSRLATDSELWFEIAASRRRVEEETGVPALHFCYPNGEPGDISDVAVENVRKCGFATAVTMSPGLNRRGADGHRLKRIAVAADYRLRYFAELSAGLHL